MMSIKDAIRILQIVSLEINSAIERLEKSEESAFEVLNIISSAEYGKQRFFKEENGLIYDRAKREYLRDFETALNRYVKEISDAE